ncbi:hypothetical protein FGE12_19540 [Aggregicoccus sp. 17bor-14]|uniref:hypothetical protein n=1 Tax=Myxococcaceae TaxID=31 RepID=UPI00129CEBC3|nr:MULTISPECIES: hypothetical protein [Myxococcaceae]MBF5044603.1 hypothetical protein [Simulacricoccus sp. 17bor-14]MRI90347.1 hypothetical protein [Aggregicoccus sp. 17bor-14]
MSDLRWTPRLLTRGGRALGVLLLLASAWAEAGTLTVRILEPAANQVSNLQVNLKVKVDSELAIAGVVARVEGREQVLSGDIAGNFQGVVDVAGLASGPHALEVVATDDAGSSASASVGFRTDRAPSVEVLAPLEGTTSRGTLTVQVRCTDDDPTGCARVGAVLESTFGQPLAEEVALQRSSADSSRFEGTLDTRSLDGRALNLKVTATDAAGQPAVASRAILVERSPRLLELAQVQGPILDFDASRILFQEPGGRILLLTLATRTATLLAEVPGAPVGPAALTANGAVFALGEQAFQWRGGQLQPLTGRLVAANAGWALLSGAGGALVRRELGSGDEVQLASSGTMAPFALGPDGDAVFAEQREVVWLDDGVRKSFTTSGAVRPAERVATDGINLTYTAEGWPVRGQSSFVTTLQTAQGSLDVPSFPVKLEQGWAAFSLPVESAYQVFVRPPTGGTPVQVSPRSNSSSVDALGAGGEVLFERDGRRFIPVAGQPERELSSALGVPRLREGEWRVALGRHLYLLQTGAEFTPATDIPEEPAAADEGHHDGCSGAGGGLAPWLVLLTLLALGRPSLRARRLSQER